MPLQTGAVPSTVGDTLTIDTYLTSNNNYAFNIDWENVKVIITSISIKMRPSAEWWVWQDSDRSVLGVLI